jgi:pyruvate formate lyase activating enzyme
VFFKGCPLECLWCHNPESQAPGPAVMLSPARCIHCGACAVACPQQAIREDGTGDAARCTACGACVEVCCSQARQLAGREMAVGDVLAEVERDRVFYEESGGGMTASGGEPLWQPEFLIALLRSCQERDIHTALDTCGYAPWQVLDRVSPYVDLFLYDLKAVDEARHRRLTGVSNDPIVRNLRALSEHGHAIVLRLPVIPGFNDDGDGLRQMAGLAASLPHLRGIALLPYHTTAANKYERLGRPYPLADVRPPSAERLAEIAAVFHHYDLSVTIGG